MAWFTQAWWLPYLGVVLFILVTVFTLNGGRHLDREKRAKRRGIDLKALGIALTLPFATPEFKPDIAGPPPPPTQPVIIAAPIEAVPTPREADALARARDDQRRFEIECLLFAVDQERCEAR